MFIKSNDVPIGTPNAVKFATNPNADLFKPSLATNLSFALSVAIVIREDIISCFLKPRVPSLNFSLNTPKSLYITPSILNIGALSFNLIPYSVRRLKYWFGKTIAPIAAPLLALKAFILPNILSISILSSLDLSVNGDVSFSNFVISCKTFHSSSRISSAAGV